MSPVPSLSAQSPVASPHPNTLLMRVTMKILETKLDTHLFLNDLSILISFEGN